MNEGLNWPLAYHRMKVAEDNASKGKPGPCNCPDCKEVMASLGLDTGGRDLVSA